MSYRVALVGNPNCGKTTLFNALTGSQQRVGNWPGVTVDRKSGYLRIANTDIEIVDIPGVYSLVAHDAETAVDERIATEFVSSDSADVLINIVDAANLERNLYLTLQLLELNKPVILALNMTDIAKNRHIHVDADALEAHLGIPVVTLTANKAKGIDALHAALITQCQQLNVPDFQWQFPVEIEQAITDLQQHAISRCQAIRLLEGDLHSLQNISSELKTVIRNAQDAIEIALDEEADILIADSRYSTIHSLCQQVVAKPSQTKKTISSRLDQILLNRYLGIPCFLGVMYCMFFFSINIGGAFQDFFDISSSTIFVDGLANLLHLCHLPNWIVAIIASGAGRGINTTITFIPIIGGMFLFLSFLESSGYMARAAFVVDRLMRAMGLPGKSFVPLIVGFGCNVPAIMSARTLDNERDRILTIIMTPFMSCGARLAIFAVFTSAFFPVGGQNVVFALYLIGIVMAVLTGLVLRKTLLMGEPSPFILELPPYHMPTFNALRRQTWLRLKRFLLKAGKVIVPVCILIGSLNAITINGGISLGDASSQSLLSYLGQWLTPLFAPMGIHADNWPATVGLLTGTLAKEVVVATLNTLYSQVGNLHAHAAVFDFWGGLRDAVMSVPHNIAALPASLGNPVLSSAPMSEVNPGVYGLMYQRFDGQLGAFAYLLFVLLYVPCITTTAVMARELNRGWTWFSVIWSTALAYGVAVIFYQAATFTKHPAVSICWISGILLGFAATIWALKIYTLRKKTAKPVIKGEGYAT